MTVLGDVPSWASGQSQLAVVNRVQTLVLLGIAAAAVLTYCRACSRAADLAAIVDSSQDAIVSVSADGIVRSWNAAAAALLGYEPAVLGHPAWPIVPTDLLETSRALLARVPSGERPGPFDTVAVDASGTRVDVSVRVSPLFDPGGEIIGMSLLLRDITGRRAADAQDERLRAAVAALAHIARVVTIGSWSTSIAHELVEPFFTTKTHGLGLGLTLSASLVEQMGGRLDVHPAGDGGHLELWLPAQAA